MGVGFDEKAMAYIFSCPHCKDMIQVARSDINCTIFRHAVYKSTMEQIPPHSSKEVCEALVKSGEVFGCGRPFTFDGKEVVGLVEFL